jgi:hypothetical protein
VGKLRRLRDLALLLSKDAHIYQGVAQGLAAGGGERPLPLLWRVELPSWVGANADQVASLLLPSVRVLSSGHMDDRAAVLLACALRQAGYKHTWAMFPTHYIGRNGLLSGVALIAMCNVVSKAAGGPPGY